jgi:hypothetical protein
MIPAPLLAVTWLALAALAEFRGGAAPEPIASQKPAAKPDGPKPKKAAAPEIEPWNGSYEDALQRAVDRNVPLVLFAIVENEGEAPHEDIEAFRNEIFTRAELTALRDRTVVAVGANRAHQLETIEVEVGGVATKKQICSVYRTEGCAAHQKLFDAIYREHNVEGELRSPAVFVIAPDRKLVASFTTGSAPDWGELVAKISEPIGKFGDPLSDAQWSDVRGLRVRGKAEIERAQWGAALATWAKVLAITASSRYAEEARAQQKVALAGLTRARDEARARIAAGEVVEGYARLVELAGQCAGTSLEKELAREIAALEKDKATKDAVAAYKRESEAEKLWSEALKLRDEGDAKKCEAKVKALLKKYADTAAGKKAREAYPKLAAD